MLVPTLLALSLAVPPLPLHPGPVTPAPEGMHPTGRVGIRGGPQFLDRVKSSPLIARVVVQPTSGMVAKEAVLPVHVDAWLKGTGPISAQIDFGGLRAMTSAGHAEILFLAPPAADGGEAFSCLQDRSEQWEVADGATGRVDQAIRDLMAGTHESAAVAALLSASPRLAQQAAGHLALMASVDPKAAEDAAAAIRDPQNLPAARVQLINMLPSRVPVATLLACTSPTENVEVRLAAIEACGRAAAMDPTKKPTVLPMLVQTAAAPDLSLKLAAGSGLGRMRAPEALAPLDAVFASRDPKLRQEALNPLGDLARSGNADAISRLEALAADADPDIAKKAHLLVMLTKPRPHPAPGGGVAAWSVAIGAILLAVAGAAVWWRRRPMAG